MRTVYQSVTRLYENYIMLKNIKYQLNLNFIITLLIKMMGMGKSRVIGQLLYEMNQSTMLQNFQFAVGGSNYRSRWKKSPTGDLCERRYRLISRSRIFAIFPIYNSREARRRRFACHFSAKESRKGYYRFRNGSARSRRRSRAVEMPCIGHAGSRDIYAAWNVASYYSRHDIPLTRDARL